MEMTGIGKIFEVEVLEGQFANGSEIAHHIAPILALEHDGDPGLCIARNTLHSGDVYADAGEALHRDLTERAIPDTSAKPDATAQRGHAVGGVRACAPHIHHHALRHHITFTRTTSGTRSTPQTH